MQNYLNKKFILDFLIVLVIFFLDRSSKIYVISQNEINLSPDLFSSKYLNISLIWNEGIAFGLLSFNAGHFYNFLSFLIAIVITVIFFYDFEESGYEKVLTFDDLWWSFRKFI